MWTPRFGALRIPGGARFRVLAPQARELVLLLFDGPAAGEHRMEKGPQPGIWELDVKDVLPGQLYSYRIDGVGPRPDPASRYQPSGVHGPSELIDPGAFRWTDTGWRGADRSSLVLYELHIGTFTTAGTFASARERLPELRDLGVTAIEIMPVADFPGSRNWGYDGVALFAPSRAYGRPEDLRALVDRAHQLDLSVILDVVYNHLGPEGAYLPQFNPQHLLARHETPWGAGVNLDGPGSPLVRTFIIDNALHWILEYHLDGLRLDATHALTDASPRHLMRELVHVARASATWPLIFHAEDHRNLEEIVRDDDAGGWGFDGVWSDDFHHIVRRMVAGDSHSYYSDFEGTAQELVRTLRQGWLYTGSRSRHLGIARGTDPSAVPMQRSVVCVQNHDQIGNRAFGERLHHQVDAATWRALSVLLLTVPMTPLLFMGQEWAASTPFLYFTDLEAGLGALVTDGRRREFRAFPEFSDADANARIPDPQAFATFAASRLRWEERGECDHAATLALYRELIALRRREPALQASFGTAGEASALDDDTVVIRRSGSGVDFDVVVRLRGAGTVRLPNSSRSGDGPREALLSSEAPRFAPDPRPIDLAGNDECRIVFARPGAIILRPSRVLSQEPLVPSREHVR